MKSRPGTREVYDWPKEAKLRRVAKESEHGPDKESPGSKEVPDTRASHHNNDETGSEEKATEQQASKARRRATLNT